MALLHIPKSLTGMRVRHTSKADFEAAQAHQEAESQHGPLLHSAPSRFSCGLKLAKRLLGGLFACFGIASSPNGALAQMSI